MDLEFECSEFEPRLYYFKSDMIGNCLTEKGERTRLTLQLLKIVLRLTIFKLVIRLVIVCYRKLSVVDTINLIVAAIKVVVLQSGSPD